jgi:hypothetical protein
MIKLALASISVRPLVVTILNVNFLAREIVFNFLNMRLRTRFYSFSQVRIYAGDIHSPGGAPVLVDYPGQITHKWLIGNLLAKFRDSTRMVQFNGFFCRKQF